MDALLMLICLLFLGLTPYVGSKLQRRLWRPLPPMGGGKVLPFRHRRDILVDVSRVQE